jgi:2-oxoglutarate ferredoxin oxidoreductase subunit beta
MRAASHRGTAFIEVYQDCNIYNHKAWFYASQKKTKLETTVVCEHGRPLIFGAERDKGLRMNGTHLEIIELGNGLSEADALVHDETDQCLAFLLSQLTHPEFPEPIGVIYSGENREPYEAVVMAQMREAIETKGPGDLKALLVEGETWTVDV